MRQMKEIATVFESQNYSVDGIITGTLKDFKLKSLCHKADIKKADGYSASEIVVLLMMMPLMALKNVHQLYKSNYAKKVEMRKDTIYRLKNNERHPWRRLLYAVAKTFKQLVEAKNREGNPAGGTKAFIIDDTTDQRTGFKMENITYVFNHAIGKTVSGFKVLTLAYFDGKSSIPLDFTVHTEKKLEKRKGKAQYKKKVDPKSNGGKRRKEANSDKLTQASAMIKRSVNNGFLADYVLADAWYASHAFIKGIRAIKGGAVHIVAGIRNDKRQYKYDGQLFNAGGIISLLHEKGAAKRCRKWNVRYMEATVHYGDIGEVKLFMCRYPKQKRWRVFITTDTTLGFVEMMRIYGIRWTIEVMFKELKQHLQFGSCQSQDFDAQIASYTISFMLYTVMAYLKRMESYETLGELFRIAQNDIREKTLAERLWELFEELLSFIIEVISGRGAMDVAGLRESEEYKHVRELFASSFLFEQIGQANMAA